MDPLTAPPTEPPPPLTPAIDLKTFARELHRTAGPYRTIPSDVVVLPDLRLGVDVVDRDGKKTIRHQVLDTDHHTCGGPCEGCKAELAAIVWLVQRVKHLEAAFLSEHPTYDGV